MGLTGNTITEVVQILIKLLPHHVVEIFIVGKGTPQSTEISFDR